MNLASAIAPAVDTTPVTLEGERVRLEPFTREHLPELAEVAFEPSIWSWTRSRITNREEFQAWVEEAFALIAAQTAVVWATRSKLDGKIAGSTRLFEISQKDRTMELGGTWLHPNYHRTGINVEAKYLQLTHAFERMNARRVAFKTHHENLASQRAIAALGAKLEGTFRNHIIMPDGSTRHSVWFSIIEEDWPEAKIRLEARMQRFGHLNSQER
jgi:RimJ/RimL family protein N-acetyltransferase